MEGDRVVRRVGGVERDDVALGDAARGEAAGGGADGPRGLRVGVGGPGRTVDERGLVAVVVGVLEDEVGQRDRRDLDVRIRAREDHVGGSLPAMATDFYLLDERLTDEERAIRDRLRAFCDREVTPIINGYWERAEFPFELVPKIAELGLAGGVIEGYGCPGMSATAAGLVSMEWARADGSIGTFFGVHSNLAMQTIHLLGSEEQRERWLPRMAALEAIGAFGADRARPRLRRRRAGDERAARRRRVRPRRGQEVDRQRVVRRRHDHLGARRGRPGRRLPRREGRAGLPHRDHHRQDVAARGVAGRDHAGRRARAGREPAAGLPLVPRRRPRADPDALHGGVARARRGARGLRGGAGLRQGARAVRAPAGLVPARAGQAQPHGGRDHRHAAAVPAPERAGGRRAPDARRWPRWPR